MAYSQRSWSRRGVVFGTLFATLVLVLSGGIAPQPAEALPCEAPNPPIAAVPPSDYYPGYGRTNADVAQEISVDEVLARAVDWEQANPTYCQSDTDYPDRHGKAYRADCSGFVSMAWHTDQAFTTVSITSVSQPISWSEVQPGDALLTDGHIELVWSVEGGLIETIGFGSTPVNHMGPYAAMVWAMGPPGDGRPYHPIRYDKIQLITDEMIREEIRNRVPNSPPVIEPPNGRSIVNWPTLFHSDVDVPWRETIEVFGGLQVELEATPASFLWNFGEGTTPATKTTRHPGVGYGQPGYENPDNRVVHKYMAEETYEPSVDITWTNYRYRIIGDDGPEEWNDVSGEHTAEGETTTPPLEIISMQSVLTDGQ